VLLWLLSPQLAALDHGWMTPMVQRIIAYCSFVACVMLALDIIGITALVAELVVTIKRWCRQDHWNFRWGWKRTPTSQTIQRLGGGTGVQAQAYAMFMQSGQPQDWAREYAKYL
jgi:hypothetical protein